MIYDECLMNNKHCFEALDHTLCDIRNCDSSPYGGLTVIHGGDFQQILPVVLKGSKEDIIYASLKPSSRWNSMNIITLLQNTHLYSSPEEALFAKWLLSIGHGQNLTDDGCIILPKHMVDTDPLAFISKMYGDMFNFPQPPPPQFFFGSCNSCYKKH